MPNQSKCRLALPRHHGALQTGSMMRTSTDFAFVLDGLPVDLPLSDPLLEDARGVHLLVRLGLDFRFHGEVRIHGEGSIARACNSEGTEFATAVLRASRDSPRGHPSACFRSELDARPRSSYISFGGGETRTVNHSDGGALIGVSRTEGQPQVLHSEDSLDAENPGDYAIRIQ